MASMNAPNMSPYVVLAPSLSRKLGLAPRVDTVVLDSHVGMYIVFVPVAVIAVLECKPTVGVPAGVGAGMLFHVLTRAHVGQHLRIKRR